ncbi:polysaccharide biosynthesis C-terminal domain-containing protein [Tamlana fucoidanivorans]|uniref:Lipopolysaccharide biosynthesis protein n=1 Tax=Allotamlana fucoidanivorans TaxID=2583814 RepID=A0A5C4SQZ6_9FLAO|nr:polysaccharide biosynthesis C-terminal domain-containing protein [Tamlana fucoidanivorans]TNJ46497.1 lipopolysaccharide biosynthesis protein [Tamlana fucoidanivorans]
MGLVATQSFKNIISTYIGFGIGAINTLFLYTKFLSDSYYGLVGFMLSLAYVIMPLMSFGMHNTLVKFYSSFKTRTSINGFLTLVLIMPLFLIVPLSFFLLLGYDTIGGFLAHKNGIIKDYLWHTIFIAIALAYFEIFFAWAKVQMQTVFGNFMKEVFHRVGTMLLLFMLFFEVLNVQQFMIGLVCVYVVRTLIMKIYAFNLKPPILTWKLPPQFNRILKYSLLIIVAGSIATILLDVDKVMLGYYIEIEQIAYYNVAIFIATVIAVPQRSMHQILMPLSAKYLNDKDFEALGDLYKRSSINLTIVGGLIFLLIVLNINELYKIIPSEFSVGLWVVFMISFVKLFDNALGSNNSILFNSDYYRMVLVLGVVLVVLMVVLNMFFIPWLGINGAGVATFLAVIIYNSIKLVFVYSKFKLFPFSLKTLKIGGFLILFVLGFYFWDFNFSPIINIVLKSVLVVVLYVFLIYKFDFSEDLTSIANHYLRRS